MQSLGRPIEILLVEDNPADALFTQQALEESKLINNLVHVPDGIEAMKLLNRQGKYENASLPDLILLDLNMPRKDGREVLAEIKENDIFKVIPVVVLTSSSSDQDILQSYNLHANAYVTKPVGLQELVEVIRKIEGFWLSVVALPPIR